MDPVSALFLVLLLLGPAAFTHGVFKRARANGRMLPSREDWHPQLPSLRAAPEMLKPVTARAREWKITLTRTRRASTAPGRRRPFQWLLIPRGSAARTKPAPASARPAPQRPAAVSATRPASPGGTSVTTPAPAPAPKPAPPPGGGGDIPSGGGGFAADFFSALHRFVRSVQDRSIRSKVTGHLAMGEGFTQQAGVLESHAKWMAEEGKYPPAAWEPLRQAAQMLRASAGKVTESGNVIAHIARTPAGELRGNAPAREELTKA